MISNPETVIFSNLCVRLRNRLCDVLHSTPPRNPFPSLTLLKIPHS